MAATVVPDGYAFNAYDLNSHAGQNLKIVYGSFDYAATYPDGGATFTIPQLASVKGVLAEPANGYTFRYVSGKLKAYYIGQLDASATMTVAEPMTEVPTDTSMATVSAVTFFAWGF